MPFGESQQSEQLQQQSAVDQAQQEKIKKLESIYPFDWIDENELKKLKDLLPNPEKNWLLSQKERAEERADMMKPITKTMDAFAKQIMLERARSDWDVIWLTKSMSDFDKNVIMLVSYRDEHMQWWDITQQWVSRAERTQAFVINYADQKEQDMMLSMETEEDIMKNITIYKWEIVIPWAWVWWLNILDPKTKNNIDNLTNMLRMQKIPAWMQAMGSSLVSIMTQALQAQGWDIPYDRLQKIESSRNSIVEDNQDSPQKTMKLLTPLVQELWALDKSHGAWIFQWNSMASNDTNIQQDLINYLQKASTDPDHDLAWFMDILGWSHDMMDNSLAGATWIDRAWSTEIVAGQTNARMDELLADSKLWQSINAIAISEPYNSEWVFNSMINAFDTHWLLPKHEMWLIQTLKKDTDLQHWLSVDSKNNTVTWAMAEEYLDKYGFSATDKSFLRAMSKIHRSLNQVPAFAEKQVQELQAQTKDVYSYKDNEKSFQQYVKEVHIQSLEWRISPEQYEQKLWFLQSPDSKNSLANTVQWIVWWWQATAAFTKHRDSRNSLSPENKQRRTNTCNEKITEVTSNTDELQALFVDSTVKQIGNSMMRQYAKWLNQAERIIPNDHEEFTNLIKLQNKLQTDMQQQKIAYFTSEAIVFAASCVSWSVVSRFAMKYLSIATRLWDIQKLSSRLQTIVKFADTTTKATVEWLAFGATYGALRSAWAKNMSDVGKNIAENAFANVGYYWVDGILAGTVWKLAKKVIWWIQDGKSALKVGMKVASTTDDIARSMKNNMNEFLGQFQFLKNMPDWAKSLCGKVMNTVIDGMAQWLSVKQLYAKFPWEMVMLQTMKLAEKWVKVAEEFTRVLVANSVGYRTWLNMTQVLYGDRKLEDIFGWVLPTEEDVQMTTVLMLWLPTQKLFSKWLDKWAGLFKVSWNPRTIQPNVAKSVTMPTRVTKIAA